VFVSSGGGDCIAASLLLGKCYIVDGEYACDLLLAVAAAAAVSSMGAVKCFHVANC
jgi:hypothetical protein